MTNSHPPKLGERLPFQFFAVVGMGDVDEGAGGRAQVLPVQISDTVFGDNVVDVGAGSIDFHRIFDAKKTAGLTHYFVEQDVCKRPPLEAIAISYKNVEKLKV